MWQAISGLCVISVPYSRQLASHAWLLHAERRPSVSCSISSAAGNLPSKLQDLAEKVQRTLLSHSPSVFHCRPVLFRIASVRRCRPGKQHQLMLNRSQYSGLYLHMSLSFCSNNPVKYLTVCFKYSVWQSFAAGFMLVSLAVARLAVSCIYYITFMY